MLGPYSPPDTGGVDATSRRSREASFDGADGREARARQGEALIVVGNGTTSSKERMPKHFGNPNHPVCAATVASHLFIDGAATPPMSGGEWRAQFIHTVIDRAYNRFRRFASLVVCLLLAACSKPSTPAGEVTEVRIPRGAGGVGFLPLLIMEHDRSDSHFLHSASPHAAKTASAGNPKNLPEN